MSVFSLFLEMKQCPRLFIMLLQLLQRSNAFSFILRLLFAIELLVEIEPRLRGEQTKASFDRPNAHRMILDTHGQCL